MKRILLMLAYTGIVLAADSSLRLGEAFDLALHHEPGYQVSTYKTASVGEVIHQAESKLYPQAQLSMSGGKYGYEAYYNHQQVSEIYKTYSLSLMQAIYHPEYLRTIDQSRSRFEGANEDLKKQSQHLGLEVARGYVKVLESENNVTKSDMQKSFLTAKYQKVKNMLDLGLANKLDYLDAKISLDRAVSDWTSAKRELQSSKVQLGHMIGYPIDQLSNSHPDYDLKQLRALKDAWMTKLANNPDYKIAEFSKKAAKDEVDIRFYDHYPKVDLNLNRSENHTNDPIAHQYDNKALVQVSIPLYQGGYTSSRVQEATLLLNAADANVEYSKKIASDRLEDLWVEYESLIESIQVLQDSEYSLKLYVEAVEKSEKEGVKSAVDVLEAKAKYESIRADRDAAVFNLLINQLGLLDLTGDLTVETIKDIERMFLDS
ncbi:TolC family protein [Sulfuricurvum sp.]|uniref:TolC family protein n=1 Tax=Sulfuricurvum sp. TaxID=2025608 RepID=UPI002628A65A|nr:TolC family protein [Sulfuricurvum sp.]MDD4950694.1 TolC family protein [Sulfuricurvum sp.]